MPTGNRLSFVSTIIPNLSLYELFRKVTTLFSYLQEFSRKVTEKVVDSLYLLQFACFIFMLVNAFFVALSPMPVAIFSTTLLYIVGPAVLLALLFFNLTFIALGNSYIPTEELLDKEENIQQYGGVEKGKNLYINCLRSAETLSKTVLTNGVWIWAIRIVM